MKEKQMINKVQVEMNAFKIRPIWRSDKVSDSNVGCTKCSSRSSSY